MTLEDEDDLRAAFWEAHPDLSNELIRDHSGNGRMYTADTRCTFVDYVDHLHRDGRISDELADSVTL